MDRKQEAQLEYYKALASTYNQRFHRENANHVYKISQIAQVLLAELKPLEDRRLDILEIGGGTGIHAELFLAAQGQLIRSFVLQPAVLP